MALRCVAREELTVTNAAVVELTASLITTNVIMAGLSVMDAPIRITVEGTDPTTSLGKPYSVGDVFEIRGHPDLSNFKCIAETSTNAAVEVQYFGTPA